MDREADDEDMAVLMGFSSFGTQSRPQKKRRYNPNADAAIAGHQAKNQPSPAFKRKTTGSNSTPLGARSSAWGETVNETHEIGLGNDDHAMSENGGPSLEQANTTVQTELDQGSAADAPHLQGLPQRPAPAAVTTTTPLPSSHGHPAAHHQRDQHSTAETSAPWYEGYYDTLSNRNPWDKLERAIGQSAKGTWLSHEEDHTAKAT